MLINFLKVEAFGIYRTGEKCFLSGRDVKICSEIPVNNFHVNNSHTIACMQTKAKK